MVERAKTVVIITDAWEPQTNGVVTTYKNMIAAMPPEQKVLVIHPNQFPCWKNPIYKDIQIPRCSKKGMKFVLGQIIEHENYNVVFHIATEGVLGFQARRVLKEYGFEYTTAYHTKFPEFLWEMFRIPTLFTRWYFNWFHKKSRHVFMSSQSVANRFGTLNTVVLSKGFAPHFKFATHTLSDPPIFLYVGRISKEKNIEAFLKIDLLFKHRKIVVGGGPLLNRLTKKYPEVEFVGPKYGEELAKFYQEADVFVFPSKTDTFGLVVLEAMACGTPVAAYPVDGAVDQISNSNNGFTNKNLTTAIIQCMLLSMDSRFRVRRSVESHSWRIAAHKFLLYVGAI